MQCQSQHKRYDILGITSSTLCLIHCLVPSFVLLGSHVAGDWFEHGLFDILFFGISFLAVITSARNSNKHIRILMWISLGLLGFSMFFEHVLLMQIVSYLAAISLIVAHSLNLKKQLSPRFIRA